MKTPPILPIAALAAPIFATSALAAPPRNYFKVQLKATADLQTSDDGVSKGKLTTTDVINGLLNAYNPIIPAGTTAAQCDIIACYPDDEDILDSAAYFLVRTRGPKDGNFKVPIEPVRFSTTGGTTVASRTLTSKNSTLKVAFQDADSQVTINFNGLSLTGRGLTRGSVVIEGANPGDTPRLTQVNATLTGYQSSSIDGVTAIGSLDIKFAKPLANSSFESLPELLLP